MQHWIQEHPNIMWLTVGVQQKPLCLAFSRGSPVLPAGTELHVGDRCISEAWSSITVAEP